jgi:uncharacterized protein
MLINLTELFTRDGKEKVYTQELEMKRFQASDDVYDLVETEPVSIHVVNAGNRTLVLDGSAKLSLMIPCSRCLELVKVPFSLTLERTLDMNQTDEDRVKDLDEQPYLQGYNLDVDQLVRDELLLNLPMKVLCDEDCKGICNRCGANLNRETCGCDRSSLDPRMSVIQDIFKQFKEV